LSATVSPEPIPPHGGRLARPIAGAQRACELVSLSLRCPSWSLTPRQLCDLELLLNGGFSPLGGFLGRGDYERVCSDMRLADGTLWPIPVTLDVPEETAALVRPGSTLFLRDPQNVPLAALHVREIWRPDREREAARVYGTTDAKHPAVERLRSRTHPCYVGGPIEGLQLPVHYDFAERRLTPAALRQRFAALGWRRIVAFQTRNPMHRAHYELTRVAMRELDARLLIHPVVGLGKPGDVDHATRARCYEALLGRYAQGSALLSLL